MAKRPIDELENQEKRLTRLTVNGEISIEDAERIHIMASAYNKHNSAATLPDGREMYSDNRKQSYAKLRTIAAWIERLADVAQEIELSDPDISADTLNKHFTEKRRDGASTAQLRNRQYATSKFYRYHADLGVDAYLIEVDEYSGDGKSWGPEDMLTREEIDAFMEAPDHPRDKAIVSLLLYTGLRNTGLRSLKIKNIDLEAGEYTYNVEDTDGEGLKDVHKPTEPRTLLQAEGPVREWLNYHPKSHDPEAYLITAKPNWGRFDPYDMVTRETIRYSMNKIADNAAEILDREEIKKPHHPHMMRHNFVTICIEDYELPAPTVKFLIGHAPWSDVMQTTYQHLTGDSHNENAKVGAGMIEADETDRKRLSPEACMNCHSPLREGAQFCDSCGVAVTPQAKERKDEIEDTTHEGAKEADTEAEKDEIDELRDLLKENPEIVDKLIDSDD